MSRKMRVLGVGAFALTLFLFSGCGRDKALDPYSTFIYDGPYPEVVVADVEPASTRYQYFLVHIELLDPNLSILPSRDAWTVQGMVGTYTIDDPQGHVLAPLPPLNQTTTATVSSQAQLRYPITILEKEWLEDNCAGFIDTDDEATVTLNATMTATRNRDGFTKTIPITFSFTLKDSNQPALRGANGR